MSTAANSRADRPRPSDSASEAPGPVAADSLAAESLQHSGGFAENAHAHVLGVKGAQSTLNATDTSGATALHAAPSGAVREKQDALAAGPDEKGATGLKLDALDKPEFGGQHSLQGYAGGPSGSVRSGGAGVGNMAKAGDSDFGASGVSGGSDKVDPNIRSSGAGFSGSGGTGGSGTTASSSTAEGASASASGSGGPTVGTGVRPHVDAAPTYTGAVTGSALSEGTFKPKGENLEDADVTNSIPQTKTFTGDVGGVHDPGRLAERAFEGQNTEPNQELRKPGEDAGSERTATAEGRGGQYDALGSERA